MARRRESRKPLATSAADIEHTAASNAVVAEEAQQERRGAFGKIPEAEIVDESEVFPIKRNLRLLHVANMHQVGACFEAAGLPMEERMERVRGIGGVFFKARDPKALGAWYAKHLGLVLEGWGGALFPWREHDARGDACTVWSPFPADTKYFEPSASPFMINFRVDDLDAMFAQLRAAGVAVEERVERSELGAFGWVMDPEGNRIELWQPPGATART